MKPPSRFASFSAPPFFDIRLVVSCTQVFSNYPNVIDASNALAAASPRSLAHPRLFPQRLSPQELSERNKRMKRAIDLSLKHTYLAHDVQKIEGTPYRSYLEIEEARCSRAHSKHALPSLAAAPFVLRLYVTRAAGSQRAAGAPREQVDPHLRCKFTYIPCCCAVSCRGLIATSIPITADRHAFFIAAPGLPTAPCLAHREAEHPRLLRRGRAQSCAQASAATKRSSVSRHEALAKQKAT
jgi:hypothetical protein